MCLGSDSDAEDSNYTQVEISAQSMEDLCQMSSSSGGGAAKSDDEPESSPGRNYSEASAGGRDSTDRAISNHERLNKKQTNYAELEFGAR